MKLHTPMSDRESSFECPSKCCAGKPKPDHATWRRQFAEIRNYCTVNKQIYAEIVEIFFRFNSWALHRARLREDSNNEPTTLADNTQHMYSTYGKKKYMKRFRHLNMQICLAPLAFVDLGTPKHLSETSTRAELLADEIRQDPEKLRKHTLNEEAQCEMFRKALEGLVSNQKKTFPKLQTLTLEITLHAPQATRPSTLTKNVLDRCGITFEIKLFLNASESANFLSGRPIKDLRGFKDKSSVETIDPKTLEPRRRMLSPLVGLSGVRKVQVKRRWIVLHRPKGAKPVYCIEEAGTNEDDASSVDNGLSDDGRIIEEESEYSVLASHMAQLHHFSSVKEMLEKATTDFGLFQIIGLSKFEMPLVDVIEVIENEGIGRACEHGLAS